MSDTPSQELPPEPRWRILAQANLDQLKTRARELLKDFRKGTPESVALFQTFHFSPPNPDSAKLADAQLVLARAHDFPSWPRFRRGVEMFNAICRDDPEAVLKQIDTHPELLHQGVNGVTSNWGPPLTCAAQMGAEQVFSALLPLPDQDLNRALDRATLKGRVAMAEALLKRGVTPQPDAAMGPCETFNLEGLQFLARIGAPLTDKSGNPLVPVASLLQGYYRDPEAKHQCLAFFEGQGIKFPDTPLMAFHQGRMELLERHLHRDADLPHRRFSCRELYPLELGCDQDISLGLHGTPLEGTTLLHMAVDFDEVDIALWLLDRGADVNAAANIDADGFGGHTPLFNAVVSQACVSCRQLDGGFARMLLDRGADPSLRASIRKSIRFISDESVHEYRNVTALEYGRMFHAGQWVNESALALIASRLEDSE